MLLWRRMWNKSIHDLFKLKVGKRARICMISWRLVASPNRASAPVRTQKYSLAMNLLYDTWYRIIQYYIAFTELIIHFHIEFIF